jgi:kinesin family protein C1
VTLSSWCRKRCVSVDPKDSTSDSSKSLVKNYSFTFDKVFRPESSQQQVFDEISQLVQSALDGYRVCIFAYGQTGSGKTYTMEGYDCRYNPENMGMIPRAVQQIFDTADSLRSKGWIYRMEASFLEIYNEQIRDLLAKSHEYDTKKHDIKHDAKSGATSVTGLTLVPVDSPEQVTGLLDVASSNRIVAETKCNDRSSRSHRCKIRLTCSVFTLKLFGENSQTNEKLEGVLNLIDLAGSERLAESGSTGERLKETQSINKSLSSLGDVIYALGRID